MIHKLLIRATTSVRYLDAHCFLHLELTCEARTMFLPCVAPFCRVETPFHSLCHAVHVVSLSCCGPSGSDANTPHAGLCADSFAPNCRTSYVGCSAPPIAIKDEQNSCAICGLSAVQASAGAGLGRGRLGAFGASLGRLEKMNHEGHEKIHN